MRSARHSVALVCSQPAAQYPFSAYLQPQLQQSPQGALHRRWKESRQEKCQNTRHQLQPLTLLKRKRLPSSQRSTTAELRYAASLTFSICVSGLSSVGECATDDNCPALHRCEDKKCCYNT
ncbi:unnamed protein product [Nippostrongylus brasiliensis]|uniref:WAP domain-containing protein n=1 Tax=Nippostrongylus brasiliensis TaxID=27835 RepID=A0A0N4YEY2_NIPBR|nr:unnamed protein product [Nippostrongylus brasiliensis]